MGNKWKIDEKRAYDLRRSGKTFKEIGLILAREDGRNVPYLAPSVCYAIRLYVTELTGE